MTSRARRTPEEARLLILDAAASLLAESGVPAVQMRAVAARVGMTDAGVAHHFGNREKLLAELLRHGGRRLRDALQELLTGWLDHDADLLELVEALHTLYQRGFGELAVALHTAGWRDPGSGMLAPVVEALHGLRRDGGSLDDTRLAVAALHQAMATEALYGRAFRRSAGVTGAASDDSAAQVRWWARQLHLALGLEPVGDQRRP
ncbi:TetR/AcrR family transcriptional regulator [Amycolatopsis regifaucium]|uniref:TetR family transcriptional regulator n=1 Tax=Amycolatopsis regifaucium TaxID=546365 RepID=A0A154M6D9_9PSEU|nr:TetR/AcrR family transcriptional regulator [Amycolatopsis regifaucium]KZB80214.1 TetR family transcriptional regulator [Amycolatopsis regifaucium]OKA09414.1 TetR family transcriptional regulator [Amycolatopsis regifaucium]